MKDDRSLITLLFRLNKHSFYVHHFVLKNVLTTEKISVTSVQYD